jgi:hypothetical protein
MTQFDSENEFRDWLLKEVRNRINAESLNFEVLESKNVADVVICKESDLLPILVFIEVKYYKGSSNRINLGKWERGKRPPGFQLEILSKKRVYFEKYLRWVICNENGKCVFANNEKVIKHAAGHEIGEGKTNNISTTIFNEGAIKISEIADEILSYLKTI